MSDDNVPSLKRILGAMIFAANRPLPAKEIKACMSAVAKVDGPETPYAKVTEEEITKAIEELITDIDKAGCGFMLAETAGGARLHSDAYCGRWVRQLLGAGRPNRLSRPSLETLAIIAYRQPLAKSEIEAIRGVNVDHSIRLLMEMQLVKITGRSELPGKPFQYGTTQTFLEHFGLKSLDELSRIDPSLLLARAAAKAATETPPEAPAQPEQSSTIVIETSGPAKQEEGDTLPPPPKRRKKPDEDEEEPEPEEEEEDEDDEESEEDVDNEDSDDEDEEDSEDEDDEDEEDSEDEDEDDEDEDEDEDDLEEDDEEDDEDEEEDEDDLEEDDEEDDEDEEEDEDDEDEDEDDKE